MRRELAVVVVGIATLAAALAVPSAANQCVDRLWTKKPHAHYRRALVASNATWRGEMDAMLDHDHDIPHPTPSDDDAWMDLMPRRAGAGSGLRRTWGWLYKYMKRSGLEGSLPDGWTGGSFLKEVSLHDVRIEPDSIYGSAQQTNLEYLLYLDPDRLVWSFRKVAGLPTPGQPYGGWEKTDSELRGHFVGHFMSATALMWASTHNETLRGRMNKVVDALDKCQKKKGSGYLSAFSEEFFDRYENLYEVWSPYYTIHKIMAGLLDQYKFAGNFQALKMVIWMAEYFGNRMVNVIKKYTITRNWRAQNEETGGMNDVLYDLYAITGNKRHLMMAHLFDKPCFLGPLAVQTDDFSGLHANTHIPIIIGSQKRYELTGDQVHKEIASIFLYFVNSSHTYVTGGTGVEEHWTDPNRLADTLGTDNEESCSTYNMLKVSRNLFRWTKEAAYADYYERSLINGVLSIQRGKEPGIMIYFTPMMPGGSKAISSHGWGTKNDSFWCCYGTATESFSKLGDSIYFQEDGDVPKLHVIQFISSTLDWKSGGIIVNQKVKSISSSDKNLEILLTISTRKSAGRKSTLNIRIPSWTSDSGRAKVNGENLHQPIPGKFLSVSKEWKDKDHLAIKLPIGLRTDSIQDDRPKNGDMKAILFGPYLLAGLTCGAWELNPSLIHSLSYWIMPVPSDYNSQLISLSQESSKATLYISNLNSSIADTSRSLTMERLPKSGTNAAVQSTFRLVHLNKSISGSVSRAGAIGQLVMLEPFDLPGAAVSHQGPNSALVVATSANIIAETRGKSAMFRIVAGLSGNPDTISLQSETMPSCYVHCGVDLGLGKAVKLGCLGGDKAKDAAFPSAASFRIGAGLMEYHPISFIAKGMQRNFLLQPYLSLRDETYTIYFKLGV